MPDQAEEICILLKRVSNLFNRFQEQERGASGAMGSGYMLSLLSSGREVNQRELVHMMQVRPASVSEMLRKLEKDGLIQRRADPRDRRNTLVSLTAKGRERESDSRDRRLMISRQMLEALAPEEREQLQSILHKLFLAFITKENAR